MFRQGLPLPYGGPTPTDQAIALRHAEGGIVNAHNVAVLVATIEEFRPEVIYLWNLGGIGGLGIAGTVAYLLLPTVWHLMDATQPGCQPEPGQHHRHCNVATTLSRRLRSVYIACSRRLAERYRLQGSTSGGSLRMCPIGQPPAERWPGNTSHRAGACLKWVRQANSDHTKVSNTLSKRRGSYSRWRSRISRRNLWPRT